ncbi:putative serine C-palmitoyltransferase [Dioscorea sansibarensis]
MQLLDNIVDRVSCCMKFFTFNNSTEKKTNSSPDFLFVNRVLKEDSVFLVTSKRSNLDKCRLPAGIRMFVSAGHSEADVLKAAESLKRVAGSLLS